MARGSLPNLTKFTREAGDLIEELAEKAELPAEAWKRLFLVTLRRMNRSKSRRLSQLCAVEAFSIAFTGVAKDREDFIDEKLRQVEGRTITRRTLTPSRGLADPISLFTRFRQMRNLLAEKPKQSRLQRLWTAWRAGPYHSSCPKGPELLARFPGRSC